MSELACPRAVLREVANAPKWLRDKLPIEQLSKADQRGLAWAWASFERHAQAPPRGDWAVWLLQAGRGFGKTRVGAEWVLAQARAHPGCRIALVGATIDEARRVMVDGESGIMACAPPDEEPRWIASRNELRFKSGAVATLYSGANGDGLRGPQHQFAWADELGKWSDAAEAWSNLQLGLRLGDQPRSVVTTTPGNDALLVEIAEQAGTVVTRGRTADNLDLPEGWRVRMEALYRGTRLGLRELDGELTGEADHALWTRDMVERTRVRGDDWGQPVRVVVGVDPPATSSGDACGIVVCGKVADGRLLVLADLSCRGLSPAGWAGRVADAAAVWGADRVVAEANNGGDMVLQVLAQADFHLPVRKVHAAVGKAARAEPMAMLFENGKAGLAGRFAELENELCHLTTGGYEGPGSPDRADAMVWALHELSGGDRRARPGVRSFASG
ncbi:phage terminase large subunit-like protein [Sphingomonas kaistensis]|uniref:Phage terminase large subunit-like protein n=1 Tax=Sphingomonas kaistensis TaxID=298708 RepID=A0A7X6BFT3_9SPHN|nr:terminase family protein [Sphingomonas kaistensis]NJC05183.1 phage terminase large subunit-like protein [Sphingomonas kaistensis]